MNNFTKINQLLNEPETLAEDISLKDFLIEMKKVIKDVPNVIKDIKELRIKRDERLAAFFKEIGSSNSICYNIDNPYLFLNKKQIRIIKRDEKRKKRLTKKQQQKKTRITL